jgi:hypothetical protein
MAPQCVLFCCHPLRPDFAALLSLYSTNFHDKPLKFKEMSYFLFRSQAVKDIKHEIGMLQQLRNKYIVSYYGTWVRNSYCHALSSFVSIDQLCALCPSFAFWSTLRGTPHSLLVAACVPESVTAIATRPSSSVGSGVAGSGLARPPVDHDGLLRSRIRH